MIELTFGESTGGSLKIAKATSSQNIIGGQSHDSGSTNSFSGISGSIGDVEALTLFLDIGEIRDMDSHMQSRKRLLKDFYGEFPGVWEEIWERNLCTVDRLKRIKESSESIRIWISEQDPYDLCGLYFICNLMYGSLASLSLVCVPMESEEKDGNIAQRSLGEILSSELEDCLEYEVPLSCKRRNFFAKIWRDLVKENGKLRAAVNGRVMSVPESFYDFALYANIPDGEFLTALLIGKTLPLLHGVGDRWLYNRIQTMIESGVLIQVSPARDDHPYSSVLKRKESL